uniref:Uncharacterized protein n=1 Tax=Candidatus Kentrum eta TaxID=2126337 RepID=A0A450U9Y6_9GAMM|nr:MAG: hypothetical protein BECKH772A_GA0070896_1000242 [Candidatus Kentron sp. H]VFJ88815.1 MAG: hypothetical protein BECKH772B_GA0070898_1000238 [Candidatus Kentron sp. H]VFJ95066.1 MAG: hypothetical protein BECKH772C_GA0070978_1000189 [Candidatus Kentron sp. H]
MIPRIVIVTIPQDAQFWFLCAYSFIFRLWQAEDGSEVARMKHDDTVRGAEFSADGSRILTWSGGTARLWDFGVDYDFPLEHLPLRVEVMTGTTMNDFGAVRTLSIDEWKRKKASV